MKRIFYKCLSLPSGAVKPTQSVTQASSRENTSWIFKTLMAACCLLLSGYSFAQINISSGGQTGTSGTGWSTSGTNPVVITATTSVTISPAVIEGYLNAGNSVRFVSTIAGININSNITKTSGAAARLTVTNIGNIKVGANVSISSTSSALDVIFWADNDNSQGGSVDDFIYLDAGATISSNGGKIVLAGGPDNGSNGGVSGDGIPDGFAWNGSNSTTYGGNSYGGVTLGPRGPGGSTVSLLSSGGDIIIRGATSNNNSFPGITSQASFRILSGAGRIVMYGQSSTGHGLEFTYGGNPSIAISSSSSAVPAIDLKGVTTANGNSGFWASNAPSGNLLIQSNSPTGGGVTIEGVSPNSNGLWLGIPGSNMLSQVLSQAGTITFRGKGGTNTSLLLQGEVYVGNAANSDAVQGVTPVVTASAANISLQGNEQYQFSTTTAKNTNFSSTGMLSLEAYTPGYTGTISWTGNRVFGNSFSSIVFGKSTENYRVVLNNSLSSAGDITAYTSDFTLADGVGLASTGSGNITINANGSFITAGTARRSITTVNGNILINADADASSDGTLDVDYLTLNPGTGTTTLRGETLSWTTTSNTDKPYLNGTGPVVIESADASFGTLNSSLFFFDQDANGMAGLRLGKAGNAGDVNINSAVSVAGPISLYGGIVSLTSPMTSTATGDIFIKSSRVINGGGSVNASSTIFKTGGAGTLTMQSQDRLNSGTITATAPATLNVVLWSDFGNVNNGGVTVGNISTNGGNVWAGGSNSNGGSYTWNGLTVGNGPSVGNINNNNNGMDFLGPINTNGGNVLIWAANGSNGNGLSMNGGPSSINAGAGNITLIAKTITQNELTLTTTGTLSLLPDGGAYAGTPSWNGTITANTFNGSNVFDFININNFSSLGGLSIGYYAGHLQGGVPVVQANSSAIVSFLSTSIAGPISFYGNALNVVKSLVSTGGGKISLTTNSLTIDPDALIISTGILSIQPVTPGTNINLAGGTGGLAISADNFNTNFVDGFSEIQIGNSSANNITLSGVLGLKDNFRLTSAAGLTLNEMLTLGGNDLRVVGNAIANTAGKYIVTLGSGKVFLDIANGANRTFPIGTDYINPVTISNNTGVQDNFYATVTNGVYSNGGTFGTSVTWNPRVDQTWNVGNAAGNTGAGSVGLLFGWNAANQNGPFSQPKLKHHDGAVWNDLGGSSTYNSGANTLAYTSYTGNFSPFAITEANVVLPLTWLSFTGKQNNYTIDLAWETASEVNTAYFDIERSEDAAAFSGIGRVAATQFPAAVNSYQFSDINPLAGRSFYRLKQVDVNGKITYSKLLQFNSNAKKDFSIVATPGAANLILNAPQSLSGKTMLSVFDANGRKIFSQQVVAGRNLVPVSALTTHAIYFIKLTAGNEMLYSGQFFK